MSKSVFAVLAAISLFALSCTGEDEPKDVSTPVSITLDYGDMTPAPVFSSVSRVAVYQICGTEISSVAAMVKVPATGGSPTVSATFTRKKGNTYKYIVVSPSPSSFSSSYVNIPSSSLASRETPPSSSDVLWGETGEMSFEEAEAGVKVPLKRYGAVIRMKVNSAQASSVSGATITFPVHVFGRLDLDPASSGIFTAAPSSRSIDLSNIAQDNVFRSMPLSLKKGDVISVRFTFSDQSATAEYTVPEDITVSDGEVFEFGVSPTLVKTFRNPVKTDGAWADPTIWKDGNTFYTTSTNGLTVWKSTDLVSWSKVNSGILTTAAKNSAKTYGNDFWAPDMIKIGSNWVLYISVRNSAADSGICVFKSSSPTSNFSFVGRITDAKDTGIKDSIDPEAVIDPTTGKTWLFFGSVGKMHRVEMASDGLSLKDEKPTYTHVAGLDINQNSSRSKVYEGCYLHYHGGYWYLFGSAGNYANYTYKIVMGRSQTLEGTFVDRSGRKMTDGYAETLMSSANGDAFYGPGHNGEIFTDSTGQDYILYHCHYNTLSPENPGRRYLCLQRIFWGDDGWPYVTNGKPAATDVAPIF